MFGPLGLSLATQVKQSRALTKALTPIANAYARAAGHRQIGLKYDDLIMEERDDVQKALSRLPPAESYDRVWRIRRAVQQSILHKDLPKDEQIKPEEDKAYLQPLINEVVKEDAERAYWDTVEATPARK